eukprot:3863137-Prymnesium_polylepis.1
MSTVNSTLAAHAVFIVAIACCVATSCAVAAQAERLALCDCHYCGMYMAKRLPVTLWARPDR